jgi:hypothetical protein
MKYALFNYQTETFCISPNGQRMLFNSFDAAQHEANILRVGCIDLHPVPVEDYAVPGSDGLTMRISAIVRIDRGSDPIDDEQLKAEALRVLSEEFVDDAIGRPFQLENVVEES